MVSATKSHANTAVSVPDFRRVVGSSQEKQRMEIVKKFFSENYQKTQSEELLKKIHLGDLTCRLLYNEETAVGIVVFKKALTNVQSSDLTKSLEIQVLQLIDKKFAGKNYEEILWQKILDNAKDLHANAMHIKLLESKTETEKFLQGKDFKRKNNDPLLCKTLENQESNSKHEAEKMEAGAASSSKTKRKLNVEDEVSANDNPPKKKLHTSSNSASNSIASSSTSGRFSNSAHTAEATAVSYQSNHAYAKPCEVTLRKEYIHKIQKGTKTIEGRINSGIFSRLFRGQKIRFFYTQNPQDDVVCEIVKINKYSSFREMLEKENFKSCLPEASSIDAAVETYHSIPSFRERAAQSGVLAIHLKTIKK